MIVTPRLELVLLDLASPRSGFHDPHDVLRGADDVVELRRAQVAADPRVAPWLLRAMVLRDARTAIGFINFHAAPDERGMVEIGYEVLPAFRRRGYASEAASAMIAWAGEHGASIVRASASPDNVPSLAMIAKQGFVQVGEQLDEIDGRELVFERAITAEARWSPR